MARLDDNSGTRNILIRFLVSAAEHEEIEAAASARELTKSDLIRETVLREIRQDDA